MGGEGGGLTGRETETEREGERERESRLRRGGGHGVSPSTCTVKRRHSESLTGEYSEEPIRGGVIRV